MSKNSEAKAAVNNERANSRNFQLGRKGTSNSGPKTVQSANMVDHCLLKNAELAKDVQKYEGRVCEHYAFLRWLP